MRAVAALPPRRGAFTAGATTGAGLPVGSPPAAAIAFSRKALRASFAGDLEVSLGGGLSVFDLDGILLGFFAFDSASSASKSATLRECLAVSSWFHRWSERRPALRASKG